MGLLVLGIYLEQLLGVFLGCGQAVLALQATRGRAVEGEVVGDELFVAEDEATLISRGGVWLGVDIADEIGVVVIVELVGRAHVGYHVGILLGIVVKLELDGTEEGKAHEADIAGLALKTVADDVEGLPVLVLEIGGHGIFQQVVVGHAGGVGLLIGGEGALEGVVFEEGTAQGGDIFFVNKRICCLGLRFALCVSVQTKAADEYRQKSCQRTLLEVLDFKSGLVFGVNGENLFSVLLSSGDVLVEVRTEHEVVETVLQHGVLAL